MNPIRNYLERQQKRLFAYNFLEFFLELTLILGLIFQIVFLFRSFIPVFKAQLFLIFLALPFVGFFMWAFILFFKTRKNYFKKPNLTQTAELVEYQSKYFTSVHRGELRTVGWFFDHPANEGTTSQMVDAHTKKWSLQVSGLIFSIYPLRSFFVKLASVVLLSFCLMQSIQNFSHHIPSPGLAWTPSSFEIKQPYEGAEWKTEMGAISGIRGSSIRFSIPQYQFLQTYLFFTNQNGKNFAIPCSRICEINLTESGRYAIGTLFKRSSFFPLQVQEDEAPRGILMAEIKEEFVSGAVIQLRNIKDLKLKALCSDDIRIESVQLIHSSQAVNSADIKEEIIFSKSPLTEQWKNDWTQPLTGWTGGQHQLFLRVRDQNTFTDSAPLTIIYADEETMRAQRLLNLRSMVDEWVHVLGDLLEAKMDNKVPETLEKRLSDISYDVDGGSALINAYVKELKLLAERIQKWIKYSPDMSNVSDLVKRTERQILYGLSLLFQEKTGDIQATQRSLSETKGDLSELLDKIKNGKLDFNSDEIQKAFDDLARKLEELQSKIRDLPSGPNDELLNRDALEAQLEESESLAKKIEDIKQQLAQGDSKGAMRELESLLNQLSILTKEMERSLEQWKENADKGSVQASQNYQKAVEDLIKRQEKLLSETEELKRKSEKLKEESAKRWEPEDPKKTEMLQKEFNEKKGAQKEIADAFQKAREAFDKEAGASEWKEMLRSEEMLQDEEAALQGMKDSESALSERKAFDSMASQKDVIESLKKSSEGQKQIQQQLQEQQSAGGRENNVNGGPGHSTDETILGEGKGDKERRKKIMDALQQKVDEKFQKSHQKYFEDLLQR